MSKPRVNEYGDLDHGYIGVMRLPDTKLVIDAVRYAAAEGSDVAVTMMQNRWLASSFVEGAEVPEDFTFCIELAPFVHSALANYARTMKQREQKKIVGLMGELAITALHQFVPDNVQSSRYPSSDIYPRV